MKKSLILVITILGSTAIFAQSTFFVGNGAVVTTTEGSLVYTENRNSGKAFKSLGKVDNYGNFKVVGPFDNSLNTTNESKNFILYYNPATNKGGERYGQLWIEEETQANVVGKITKKFKVDREGAFQDIALPFERKLINELTTEFGRAVPFDNQRWKKNNITVTNNTLVRADNVDVTKTTNDVGTGYRYAYYSLANQNGNVTFTNEHEISGVPFSKSDVTVNLSGAGAGINFGDRGSNRNIYKEKYSTYVRDHFAATDGNVWSGDYGKNLYQISNPFFVNLDLSMIPQTLRDKIRGIRISLNDFTYDTKGVHYGGYKYITFTGTGAPVGDEAIIIKPMQSFLIKMKDGQTGTLDLSTLRVFSYTPQNNQYSAASGPSSSGRRARVSETRFKQLSTPSEVVKQLAVIALDEQKKEIGRAYYAVYENAITGMPNGDVATAQAQASTQNAIGFYEEKRKGGWDKNAYEKYGWLYINEANEKDFKGKRVLLGVKDDVKYFKFEIKYNSQFLEDGAGQLPNGESFYIRETKGSDSDLVKINNGAELPVGEKFFNVYYGQPNIGTLATEEFAKNDQCKVVYDKGLESYRLIFSKNWNKANVQIYDLSGKIVKEAKNVATSSDFIFSIPVLNNVYVVTAVSENGEKFSQKIIK